MKKLMMILSVALSFGLFADALPTGVNFEAFGVGPFDFSRLDDNKVQSQATDLAYWIYGDDADGTITEGAGRYAQGDAPDAWKNSVNEKFLHLDGGLVYRTALSCISKDNERNNIATQATNLDTVVSFKENPVYFDTMVKFTAFEDLPTEMVDSAAKLAVFAYAPENGGYTNLVISGGYVGEGRTFTNYVTDGAVDLSKWYRLTIRALNVGKSGDEPAFLVYLDEELVSRREGDDCGLVAENLNAIGAKNSASIIPSFRTGVEVCAMGFSGNGDIDDLSITEAKPAFIVEESTYTINWSEGVATLKIDDGDAFAVEGSGSTNVTLATGVTAVTITATYADGYERGTWKKGSDSVDGNEFKDVVGAELYIDAMIPLYDIDGKHYASIAAALADVKPGATATIKMLASDVLTDALFVEDMDIVFDLAGKTLTGGEDAAVFYVKAGGKIEITDSIGGGSVVPVEGADAVYFDDGSLKISGGKFCGSINDAFAYEDEESGESFLGDITLSAGLFLDEGYEPEEYEFYMAAYIEDGVEGQWIQEGDLWYYQVGEAPEPPTTFTVTVGEAPAHATVTVLSNETQIAYAESYTLDLEDTLKVTYAIAEGDEDTWEFAQDAVVEFVITKDSASKAVAAPTVVEKKIEPTTYAVSFYTNSVDVANLVAVTNIAKDAELTADEIPAIFAELEGTWDSNPVGAVITEATNFVFTIKAPEPTVWTVTFSTNTIAVAEKETSVADGGSLETEQIPAFEGGAWDVDPTNAVITCNTNFNYTIAAGKTYPTYIMDHASDELKAKFDEWATNVAKDRDAESLNLDAFLLNCTPANVDEEKAKFVISSIVKDSEGNWVVKVGDKGQDDEYGNGYINIISVKADKFPTAGDDADFFQATLVIEPVVKE